MKVLNRCSSLRAIRFLVHQCNLVLDVAEILDFRNLLLIFHEFLDELESLFAINGAVTLFLEVVFTIYWQDFRA